MCSTGSPQGCVLSPLLFVLSTNDCLSMFESRFIVKFTDGSVIISLLQDHEVGHGPVLDNFIKWYDSCLIIDFCWNPLVVAPTFINGTAIETGSQCRYLGTILDYKMTFDANADSICKKANRRHFFLRKLRDFN